MKRLAFVVLGSCTLYFGDGHDKPPSPPPDPPPQETPREEFDDNVYPVLTQNCGGCHVGGSVSLFGDKQTSDSYYDAIVASPALNGGWIPADSELFIKGVHEGPALTAADTAAIAQWLIDEGKVRGTDPPQPDDVEAQWAACLSISKDLLMQSGGYQIASAKSDDGSCSSCHAAGAGGAVFSTNVDAMLASWETRAGLEDMFVPQAQADGSIKMQLAEAKLDNKGQEKNEGTGTHPSYLLDSQILGGLDEFVVAVQARLDAGACPAPLPNF